jgi:hypothetical protein
MTGRPGLARLPARGWLNIMNIYGINPNANIEPNVKAAGKPAASVNYNGPSFAQNISEIARAADLQVAQGATASELRLRRQKEGVAEKPFDLEEANEELLEDYIGRIKQMLDDLKK